MKPLMVFGKTARQYGRDFAGPVECPQRLSLLAATPLPALLSWCSTLPPGSWTLMYRRRDRRSLYTYTVAAGVLAKLRWADAIDYADMAEIARYAELRRDPGAFQRMRDLFNGKPDGRAMLFNTLQKRIAAMS